ncbi:NAD(P)-dependent oxidoreductase [Acidisoma cellulosilytica]|uniref:NAD(P)-dependent oxidoreductase n=1 Tax=Acidisoma cellulosilyticum TaxID=2802395 RepID=A0A964E4V7_9PROT|nr:NAD(P)-dependent oxidoreductase [Acidisoma cellulosilyticum]MCB8881343.1 NAD(P)-dependent oxidoreductase [Acidisoma cellulosilyticum]
MDDVVLVTGAAGLLGRAVCDRLESEGKKVIATDMVARTTDGCDLVQADLTDIHRLHAIIAGRQVSGIIHCGAFSGPMVGIDNPYRLVEVNVMGTVNLLELARIHKIPRVVCCSSTSAYGDTPAGPVAEDVVLRPSSVYGATKAAIEPLIEGYARQHGVDGLALRFSWIYGPGRTTDCVIRTMISDALTHKPTRMSWGLDFPRQFIHVDDAASALILALRAKTMTRRTYTLTGGTYLTLGEIADIVRRVLPSADVELAMGPDPLDDRQAEFDTTSAQSDLGFYPAKTMEAGILSYTDWLRERLAVKNS